MSGAVSRPVGVGSAGDAPPRPQRAARSRSTHTFNRTHEVDLREARDQLAGRLAPGATGRGGVNDDGGAGLGEELGRVRQGTVQNLPVRFRDPTSGHQLATHLVEIERAHGDSAGCQCLDETQGHCCLARTWPSSDPDRPAGGTSVSISAVPGCEPDGQIRKATRRLRDRLAGRVDDQFGREGGPYGTSRPGTVAPGWPACS